MTTYATCKKCGGILNSPVSCERCGRQDGLRSLVGGRIVLDAKTPPPLHRDGVPVEVRKTEADEG